jgi:hypothetical protein
MLAWTASSWPVLELVGFAQQAPQRAVEYLALLIRYGRMQRLRGRHARRRGHVPELWPGRGGADRIGGSRRQEPRGVVADHRPQLLELGLIDEIDLHLAPIPLGQGIRPYDNRGNDPIRPPPGRRRRPDVAESTYATTAAKTPIESASGD